MSTSLAEALPTEIQRCSKLIEIYKSIPTGGFGALMIQRAIDAAIKAIRDGDTVAMIRAYQALKDCE